MLLGERGHVVSTHPSLAANSTTTPGGWIVAVTQQSWHLRGTQDPRRPASRGAPCGTQAGSPAHGGPWPGRRLQQTLEEDTIADPEAQTKAVDLVKRVFGPGTVERDRIHAVTTTCVRTSGGLGLLASVSNLASRKVVRWALADHTHSSLTAMHCAWRSGHAVPGPANLSLRPDCPTRAQGVVAILPCWAERSRSRASAGVLQPRVLRGRLLRAAAAARSSTLRGRRYDPSGL